VAIGRAVSTQTRDGAMCLGDSSTTDLRATTANAFYSRFAGGYKLFSDAGATAGAELAAGSGAWSSLSDVNVRNAHCAAACLLLLVLRPWCCCNARAYLSAIHQMDTALPSPLTCTSVTYSLFS
jgi:hypothetical protein